MRKLVVLLLSLLIVSAVLPPQTAAQTACGSTSFVEGPELAIDTAGTTVVSAQNFNGPVSVINYLNKGELTARNTVPNKTLNPVLTLRVEFNNNTPDESIVAWAQSLNANYQTEFPCGVKAIVASVEMSNLDWWYDNTGNDNDPATIRTAAREYARKFRLLAETLNVPSDRFPLAPAPPDLFNGRYNADPWMQAFVASGACQYVDVNVADIFDLTPTVGGGNYNFMNIHQYQEQALCGKPVVHFQGWGINPNEPAPGPEVSDQVEWYETHDPPGGLKATTLIVPICGRVRQDPYFWYYADGRVYTVDGEEVDLTTCSANSNPFDPSDWDTHHDACRVEVGEVGNIAFYEGWGTRFLHSFRPYPGCPFDPTVRDVQYYMCGQDLVATENLEIRYQSELPENIIETSCVEDGNVATCTYQVTEREIPVEVDLTNTKFPIMGLTEDPYIHNRDNENKADNAISYEQQVNEYVGWYLNGVINKAEDVPLEYMKDYPPLLKDPEESAVYRSSREYWDTRKLINLSGPVKKLIPWRIQSEKRIESIEKVDEDRRDQVVVCYYQFNIPGIPDDMIPWEVPGPCWVNMDDVPGAFEALIGGLSGQLGGALFGDIGASVGEWVGDKFGDVMDAVGGLFNDGEEEKAIVIQKEHDGPDGFRLKDWRGDFDGDWEDIAGIPLPEVVQNAIGGDRPKRPPTDDPRDPNFSDYYDIAPEDFDFVAYYRAYVRWRGYSCSPQLSMGSVDTK